MTLLNHKCPLNVLSPNSIFRDLVSSTWNSEGHSQTVARDSVANLYLNSLYYTNANKPNNP